MWLTYLFIFIFGLIIGSFLNCLIWRLYSGETLFNRSHCLACGKKIYWYDNIPLLSFMFLRGRCRHCGSKISWQYPFVEFAVGALFLLSFYLLFPSSLYYVFTLSDLLLLFKYFLAIFVMILIFVYDLRWYLILDLITLPSIFVFFILNLYLGFNFWNLFFGFAFGFCFFLFQYIISRGKWIGGGDIRMGGLMGVILAWPNILLALFLAYIFGAIVGIVLMLFKKKNMKSELPFGVFLSTATLITLFWGDLILKWYLGFF